MILRFKPDATIEDRSRAEAALYVAGIRPQPREGALFFRTVLDAEELTALAALPGVESVSAEGRAYTTLRVTVLGWISDACLVCGLLTLIAALFPADLGAPADPLRTPAGLRPAWPLLPTHGMTESSPHWFPASLVPLIAFVGVLAWPWIGQRLAERSPKVHTAVGVLVLVFVAWMTYLGVSR